MHFRSCVSQYASCMSRQQPASLRLRPVFWDRPWGNLGLLSGLALLSSKLWWLFLIVCALLQQTFLQRTNCSDIFVLLNTYYIDFCFSNFKHLHCNYENSKSCTCSDVHKEISRAPFVLRSTSRSHALAILPLALLCISVQSGPWWLVLCIGSIERALAI